VARHRIAVALLVAEPLATELDGLRRALGAAERERVPPHATLVSPINLQDEPLLAALDLVRRAAEASAPLALSLGPATTFAPATPTVHLAVGGPDRESLLALRAAMVAEAPLARADAHEFVPHVTLAQVLDPAERIPAALEVLAAWEAEVTFDRVHVLRQGGGTGRAGGSDDKVWVPFAESSLGGGGVVGRGGVELTISVTGRPDPEAAALLALDGAADGSGTPFAIAARHADRVAGAAWGWSSGSVAIIADLAVAAAHRGQGIGRKVLDAVEAEAASRGCDVLLIAAAGGGPSASLLSGAGWQAAGEAVADGRRLWRRELRPT
jgi:2'-5' RNA ligase/GNAT superfamily N-acetyltransferase